MIECLYLVNIASMYDVQMVTSFGNIDEHAKNIY